MKKEKLVVLSLGSNIGDRELNLQNAISELELIFETKVEKSPIYQSEAWGFETNNLFLNCCVSLKTNFAPKKVLKLTQSIELKLGRVKKVKNNLYESRIIDLDILYYDDIVLNTDNLKIPHPLLSRRAFVLKPLGDIVPGLIDPVIGRSVKQLLMDCNDQNEVILYNQ